MTFVNNLTSCAASSNSNAADTADYIEQHNFLCAEEMVETVVHNAPKYEAHSDYHIRPCWSSFAVAHRRQNTVVILFETSMGIIQNDVRLYIILVFPIDFVYLNSRRKV